MIECPYCGRDTQRVPASVVYGPRGENWRDVLTCLDYPGCDSYVGCDENNKPLGTLADKPTREARRRAHAALDPLWRTRPKRYRRRLYARLSVLLGLSPRETHIGLFDVETCERVVEIIKGGEK